MTLPQTLADSNWLLFRIRMDSDQVEFAHYPQEMRKKVNCLSAENYQSSESNRLFSVSEFAKMAKKQSKPLHFIFHSAFCASTLLSRCFDLPGTSHSLREPLILQSLANAARLNWRSPGTGLDWQGLLPLALGALQNNAGESEQVVIKPLNTTNNLIPAILSAHPKNRAILLYSDLDRFVLSTLSKGEEARVLVRNMFNQVRLDIPALVQMSAGAALPLSDLMIMVSLWRMQVQQFEMIANEPRLAAQIRTLQTEIFLQNRDKTLTVASDFLNLSLEEEQIKEILNGPVFGQDAKRAGKPYDRQAESKRKSKLKSIFQEDIKKTYTWMRSGTPGVQTNPILPAKLI